MKKKIFILFLLTILTAFNLMLPTYASEVTYILDPGVDSHTHTLPTTIDLNQVTISMNDELMFDKGEILSDNIELLRFNENSFTLIGFWITDTVQDAGFSIDIRSDGTYLDNKVSLDPSPITITIDESYVPEIPIYQVIVNSNTLTPLYTYYYLIEENGFVDLPDENPTKAPHTFGGWYDQVSNVEITESTPITSNMLLKPQWIPDDLPEIDFNEEIVRHDYTYHYFDDEDTIHDLTTIDISELTLYVNDELVYDRGDQVDTDYTISTTTQLLEITDNVNTETTTINSNGTFTWTTNITSLMFLISPTPLNYYYMGTDDTFSPFSNLYNELTDIYSYEDTIHFNTESNDSLYIPVSFLSNRVVIKHTLSDTLSIINVNDSEPYELIRQGTQRPYLFVVFYQAQARFDDYNKTHEYVNIDITGNTITLSQNDQYYHSFESDNLAPYLNLERDKYYKISVQNLSTESWFDSLVGDNGYGLFYIIQDYEKYIHGTTGFISNESFVIKATQDLDLRILGKDIKILGTVQEYQYRLSFTEVIAHEIDYIEPFDLTDRSRSMLLSFDPNPVIDKMLESSSFYDEYVEHEETATEPTVNLDDFDIVGYYDLTINEWFDFNDPIVSDHDVQPILVPKVDNVVVFDSQGGSYVDYQILQEGQKAVMPTPPTKTGYTFSGWYLNDDVQKGLNQPISELNGLTLSEVFEENSIYAVGKNLFDEYIDGEYYNGVTGEIQSNAVRSRTNLIQVKPSTTYYHSIYGHLNSSRDVVAWDSEQNIIGSFSTTGTYNFQFTTGSNVHYITISFLSEAGDFNSTGVYAQLEVGTVATTYEPYKSSLNNDNTPFVYWYNLDILDIDNLTKEQMDYYYNLYRYWIEDNYDIQEYLITEYDFTSIPDDDVYLVAKWIENEPGDISITYNSMGGSYIAPISFTPGDSLNRPNDPYLEGFEFKGWYYDNEFTELVNFSEDNIISDTMLYALFYAESDDVNQAVTIFAEYWFYIAIGLIFVGIISSLSVSKYKGKKRKKWY